MAHPVSSRAWGTQSAASAASAVSASAASAASAAPAAVLAQSSLRRSQSLSMRAKAQAKKIFGITSSNTINTKSVNMSQENKGKINTLITNTDIHISAYIDKKPKIKHTLTKQMFLNPEKPKQLNMIKYINPITMSKIATIILKTLGETNARSNSVGSIRRSLKKHMTHRHHNFLHNIIEFNFIDSPLLAQQYANKLIKYLILHKITNNIIALLFTNYTTTEITPKQEALHDTLGASASASARSVSTRNAKSASARTRSALPGEVSSTGSVLSPLSAKELSRMTNFSNLQNDVSLEDLELELELSPEDLFELNFESNNNNNNFIKPARAPARASAPARSTSYAASSRNRARSQLNTIGNVYSTNLKLAEYQVKLNNINRLLIIYNKKIPKQQYTKTKEVLKAKIAQLNTERNSIIELISSIRSTNA